MTGGSVLGRRMALNMYPTYCLTLKSKGLVYGGEDRKSVELIRVEIVYEIDREILVTLKYPYMFTLDLV